jgi:hypothetical protein
MGATFPPLVMVTLGADETSALKSARPSSAHFGGEEHRHRQRRRLDHADGH